MIDLKENLGFTVKVEGNKLSYDGTEFEPAQEWEKTLDAGKYAYKDPASELDILYFGARYMEKTADEDVFVKNDMMLDLTVINPGKVGEEYVKTVGHYHGNVPGQNIAYPEVYEAVSGKLEYLLQSEPDRNGEVEVIWVVAEPGDKVVMAPGYGHVSMNVGSEPAVETDLQKRNNPDHSDYSLFKEKQGGAYLRVNDTRVPNQNYRIKSFKIVRPKEKPEFGLKKSKTLYQSFVESPEKFDWLKNPKDYDFSDLWIESAGL